MPKKKSTTKKADEKPMFSAHIPDNIKKQGEKADALMAGKDPATDPEPTDPPKKVEPTNPEPARVNPSSPEPAKPADPPKEDNWEQKYKVLQGKYDTEIPELRRSVEQLTGILAQQAETIEKIHSTPQPAAEVNPTTTSVDPNLQQLNPDDFMSYGDEIVDFVKVFNAQQGTMKELLDKINSGTAAGGRDSERFNRVEKLVQQTASDRYMENMDKAIPNWRTVNNSPEFKQWLTTVDPLTKYRYNDIIRFAAQNLDHEQAIAIFKRYAMDSGVKLGEPVQSADPTSLVRGNGIVDETIDPLAGQVMPSESVGGGGAEMLEAGGTNPNNNMPTAQELTQASLDYARGKISMREFNEISNRYQVGLTAQQNR